MKSENKLTVNFVIYSEKRAEASFNNLFKKAGTNVRQTGVTIKGVKPVK